MAEQTGKVPMSFIQSIEKHRFLLEELVMRDFKKKYKGTVLGMAWSILNPLLMLLIMWVVFSHFFGDSIPHYTTYLFCGTVVFSYFSEATAEGLLTLVGNAQIITKVNTPKYLFLLSKSCQTLLNFALTLIVFFLLCALDGITFSFTMIALLYPIAMLFIFNAGLGLILSALYVFFRDMQYFWAVFSQLLLYVSAVFYPVEGFPEIMRNAFVFNPVYDFITYFRTVVIDGSIPSLELHLILALFAFVTLAIGILVYRKYDSEFVFYI